MGVLNPVRVVIENYPEGTVEAFEVVNNPEDASRGTRQRAVRAASCSSSATTSARIRRRSSSGWRRVAKCACGARTSSPARRSIKDAAGEVIELRCTYDPATRGGDAPDGRKVKATLHWVSAAHALDAEVRLYDRLFNSEIAGSVGRFPRRPQSGLARRDRRTRRSSRASPASAPGTRFQFERLGYFCVDRDSTPGRLVFNRTVTLKDAWATDRAAGLVLRTVFLDAGGVLVFPNWTRISAGLAKHGVLVDPAALARAEAPAKRTLDVGATIDATNDAGRGWLYFNLILEHAGVPVGPATEAALAELHAYHQETNLWELLAPDVMPVLARLRARSLHLTIVSNANGKVRVLFDRLALTGLVDCILDSHEEGVEKPDPRFFEIALARSGATRETTIHVGESVQRGRRGRQGRGSPCRVAR